MKKCNIYIDGYNFYYAIPKDRIFLGWCDFFKLSKHIIPNDYLVKDVYYFSAWVGSLENRKDEKKRQQVWLNALKYATSGNVITKMGFHKLDSKKINKTTKKEPRVEKTTDVSIAVHMIKHALVDYKEQDLFVLVCADKDQLPTIQMLASDLGRKVIVCFPPSNDFDPNTWKQDIPENVEIVKITEKMLELSMLPIKFRVGNKWEECPDIWREQNQRTGRA